MPFCHHFATRNELTISDCCKMTSVASKLKTFVASCANAPFMIRDKANFSVLEGLITVLIGEPVKIEEILESEGNQESIDDKLTVLTSRPRTVRAKF